MAKTGTQILDQSAERRPEIISPLDHLEELRELWVKGLPPGDSTGWGSLDRHYTVVPGQLSVITGWPGSGKSEWLDAVLVNLSRCGWHHILFSPENAPIELHIAKLLEKVAHKPFGAGPTERISAEEVTTLSAELAKSFRFVHGRSGQVNVADVLEAAAPFLSKDLKNGLVIDPWNELEHWRPQNMSETEYVSHSLSTVRQWARERRVHVWIVAHPQKMRREDGALPIPRPDMISGSVHWWNKADCCVTVFRDFLKPDSQDVDIHVQKVRFKNVGRPGVVTLKYDRITGTYHEAIKIAKVVGIDI